MTDPKDSPSYRPDIDGLRGLAVGMVLLYHAFPSTFRFGFMGVDLFFVISGYLITGLLAKEMASGRVDLPGFYMRRAKRIFPSLVVVLVSCLVYGWLYVLPTEFKNLGRHAVFGAGFASNFLLLSETGYFGGAAALKPLLHLWSLAIEEQFYLVWPLVLALIWKTGRWTLPIAGAMLAFSFWLNVQGIKTHIDAVFYWPWTRVWELLIGALLALWQQRSPQAAGQHPGKPLSHFLAGLGLLMLLIAMVRLHPGRDFPGSWALLPTLGAALLIAAGPHSWVNHYLLGNPLLRHLGLISYALYLWHWPLFSFAHLEIGETLPLKVSLWLCALSLLLAVITTYGLERPLRFSKWASARQGLVVSLIVLSLVATAGLGWRVWTTEGFPNRLPKVIRDLSSDSVDMFAGWQRGSCLLESHQSAQDYATDCIESAPGPGPLVVFWGDSHAGALYPGVKAYQAQSRVSSPFRLGLRTGATCPPAMAHPDPWCQALNQANLAELQRIKPDVVVLHAFWAFHFYDLSHLAMVAKALKDSGVGKVVILGAPPYWATPPGQVLMQQWRDDPNMKEPPFRLKAPIIADSYSRDTEVRQLAQAAGLPYISMMDVLCTPEGCQTRDKPLNGTLISHDYGHLSLSAATMVAARVMPKILAP